MAEDKGAIPNNKPKILTTKTIEIHYIDSIIDEPAKTTRICRDYIREAASVADESDNSKLRIENKEMQKN